MIASDNDQFTYTRRRALFNAGFCPKLSETVRHRRGREDDVAVVFIADIPTMTSAIYRQAIKQVRDQLKAAPGFAHAGTATENGFRVTEIWNRKLSACVLWMRPSGPTIARTRYDSGCA